jgi:hypothetical protein
MRLDARARAAVVEAPRFGWRRRTGRRNVSFRFHATRATLATARSWSRTFAPAAAAHARDVRFGESREARHARRAFAALRCEVVVGALIERRDRNAVAQGRPAGRRRGECRGRIAVFDGCDRRIGSARHGRSHHGERQGTIDRARRVGK